MSGQAASTALKIRRLVAAIDHREALTVHRALRAYASMLEHVDREFPDPDKRGLAEDARMLADVFMAANATRDYLEDPDGP